jgi:hypothetical protein
MSRTVLWLMAAGAVVVAAAAAVGMAWRSKQSELAILGQAAKPATTASPAAAPSRPAEVAPPQTAAPPTVAVPTFDVAGIEPDGRAVIAGRRRRAPRSRNPELLKRLLLLGDIFRGRTQVAFDLVQIPLKRCAVHPLSVAGSIRWRPLRPPSTSTPVSPTCSGLDFHSRARSSCASATCAVVRLARSA